jgi:hypothetical protein
MLYYRVHKLILGREVGFRVPSKLGGQTHSPRIRHGPQSHGWMALTAVLLP